MKLKPNSAEIYGNLGKNSSSCYSFWLFCCKNGSNWAEILQCDVTIQIKATEQFFAVGVFIMMFKIILTSESVFTVIAINANEIASCSVRLLSTVAFINK